MTRSRSGLQWLGLGVAVLLLSILCGIAAQWQWHRHDARAERAQQVADNYDAAHVGLSEVLQTPQESTVAQLSPDKVWTLVELTGQYAAEHTAVLRNRPVRSEHVFHILVPFKTTTGEIIIVNRGTVPVGDDTAAPDHIPAPPAGMVTIQVNMRANEPPSGRGAPAGQVQAINVTEVLDATGGATWAGDNAVDAYGVLRTEVPAASEPLAVLPPPDVSLGNHLSYTWQWVIFGVGIWVAYIALWVRERREDREEREGLAPRAPKINRAEAEEDAIIDAQLADQPNPQ